MRSSRFATVVLTLLAFGVFGALLDDDVDGRIRNEDVVAAVEDTLVDCGVRQRPDSPIEVLKEVHALAMAAWMKR